MSKRQGPNRDQPASRASQSGQQAQITQRAPLRSVKAYIREHWEEVERIPSDEALKIHLEHVL
jgi:hypothetical protein